MADVESPLIEKKIQKSYFDVLGICCPSEAPLIESILKNLDGVEDVSVIVPTKTVVVVHDTLVTSQLQIVKALNKARLEASVRVQGVESSQKNWPSPFAIASGVLLLLSFLKYLYQPFQWLALGAVASGIIPIFYRAMTALRNLRLGDINILVVITVVGSIALEDYWEAGTIVFLFGISKWLESLASRKATAAMSSLANLVPRKAVLAETGEEVDVSNIKVNTALAVKDGEVIPIDGVVVEGNCEVDEKTFTGESYPVVKQKDSKVWAGTINMNGYISIKTTALAQDCMVSGITKLVEEAQSNRSRTQRYVEKFTMYYTPAIIVISAALAVVPAALRLHNEKEWFHIALVVLVCACPCALILSTPVAMFCALTKAATSGVFFKGANYLETLAKVKTMAFDKTGTITRAEFEVTEFRSLLDDISLSTMLYWVSSIESKSSHPMAAALVDLALSHSVEPKPEKVEQFQNFPGEGIYGKVDGKDIYIGNSRIALRAGCPSVPKIDGNFGEGDSVGYIFLGSIPAGIFFLADVCRTGAKDALKELKSMGIKTVMLTGDSYAAAKHVQDQLEGAIEVVHAELLPEDKARIVKNYQKVACTAMIGDGINDAPALATADIGISMGISGSALATETGHVILMTNDTQRIPSVACLGRKVRRKVLENMILSLAVKGSILALAIAGHPLVWAAVLADVGTCLLVIFNSMLLLRGTTRYQKCSRSSTVILANKRDNKYSGSDLLDARQPCCDVIEQKHCKVTTCCSKNCAPRHQSEPLGSSSSSYGSSNLFNSTRKCSCCGHGNGIQKGKCSDSISYNSEAKHIGESDSHRHGQINCSKSSKSLGESISVSIEEVDKNPGIYSSNIHQPCKVQACSSKNCAPRQSGALSSSSCGGSKCSDFNDEKRCCGNGNQTPKAQRSNRGSCSHGAEHTGSRAPHNGEINCSNSSKSIARDGIVEDKVHGIKHCHNENLNITSCKNSCCSSSDSGSQMISNNDVEVKCSANNPKDHLTTDELGKLTRSCCSDDQTNSVPFCKNPAAKCCPPVLSATDNLGDEDRVGCRARRTCTVAGGCCESFRKKCCVSNSGVGLGGGLSEIVIESF